MLFSRWKFSKNKKGVTLVEMIAAIAITAILASVLSMMIVPVTNSYRRASTKAELQEAVTARLNDIAFHLRGATGVYLTTTKGSFPDITKNTDQYDGVRHYDIHFGFAIVKTYSEISGYLYPELKIVDWSEGISKPTCKYPEDYDGDDLLMEKYRSYKLSSDDFQSKSFYCPSNESFYFIVKRNPDGGNAFNVLEAHLKVKKGNVEYEGVKTFVCENLMIRGANISTASFSRNQSTGVFSLNYVKASDVDSQKKYYSVWFSRDI